VEHPLAMRAENGDIAELPILSLQSL